MTAVGAAGIAGLAGCSGSGGSGGDGGEMTEGGDGGEMTEGGSTGTPMSSTVTLRVWSGSMTDEASNKQYWENMASRATEALDGVEIQIRGVPYEGQFQKIRSAVQAGPDSAPHIVEMASRKDTMLAADTLNIGDRFPDSKAAELLPEGVKNLNSAWGTQQTGEESGIVSIPAGVRPYMNVYRKDWLEAAGIDQSEVNRMAGAISWDSMFSDIYPAMKQSDKFNPQQNAFPDTTGMKEGDEEFLSHYAGQWGISTQGTLNDAATRSVLDTDRFRDLLRFQVEGINQEYFHSNSINHGDEEATTLIWNDQLGMLHVQDVADLWGSFKSELGADSYEANWEWGLPNRESNGKKSTYGLVPIFVPFEKAYTSQAERDALFQFVEFAITGDEALKRTQEVGWMPPAPKVLNRDWFSSTTLHERYWSTAQQTLEEYQITELSTVQGSSRINFEIPRQMHQRIVQQGVSIEEATRIAAEEQNAILRENGRYEPR